MSLKRHCPYNCDNFGKVQTAAPWKEDCPNCKPTAPAKDVCPECKGRGEVPMLGFPADTETCPTCHGTGKREGEL